MASSSSLAGPRRHRLSTHECRSWLVQHHEGRLDYRTGRGPRSLVVRYAVDRDAVLVRVPTFNDLLQYAPGESVTLEVDERVAPDSVAPGGAIQTGFESVHVTGTATIVDSAPPDLADDWPADLPTKVISVPIQRIDGFFAAAP